MQIVKELQEMKKQYEALKDKTSIFSDLKVMLRNELSNIVDDVYSVRIKYNGAFNFCTVDRLSDEKLSEIENKLNCYLYDERIDVRNVGLLEDGTRNRIESYAYTFMIEL